MYQSASPSVADGAAGAKRKADSAGDDESSHKVSRFAASPTHPACTAAVQGGPGIIQGGLHQASSVLASPTPVPSYSSTAVSPSPAPLSSPTAAFVAGAAAVASVLSKPLLGNNSGSPSVSDLKPAEEGMKGGLSAGPGAEVALDVARAAAAAAAAVSARQAVTNNAAMALQMAMKTAELLQGGTAAGAATPHIPGSELNPQTRHARKVYVGNLPNPATQAEVHQFFNELLEGLLPNKVPGQTIIHVYVNTTRRFAFLEHRSIEEANFTIGLDGVVWRGCPLILRRPQDYNPQLAEMQFQEERARLGSMTGLAVPPPCAPAPATVAPPQTSLIAGALGIISTTVPDSPHKIFIGGLPHSITDQGCKQLLEAFGQLRALHVVKDPQRGDCKGFAFCEYLDPNVTDVAVAGLNNMRIADRVLQVRRAMPHGQVKQPGASEVGGGITSTPAAPSIVGTLSRVIAIHNMLPVMPLVPPLLKEATASEARIRAAAYGEVLFVDVLDNLATAQAAKGEGVPVLVEFKDVDSAIQAMSGIQGSSYDGRPLSVVFAEPSAAMKKAKVLRIIQEAGGGAAITPPKSQDPSSSQQTLNPCGVQASPGQIKQETSTQSGVGVKNEHRDATTAPHGGLPSHSEPPAGSNRENHADCHQSLPGSSEKTGVANEEHAQEKQPETGTKKEPVSLTTTAANAVLAGSAAVAQLLGTGIYGGGVGKFGKPVRSAAHSNSSETKDQDSVELSTMASSPSPTTVINSACTAEGSGVREAAADEGERTDETAGAEIEHGKNGPGGDSVHTDVPRGQNGGTETDGHSSDVNEREAASSVPGTEDESGERKEAETGSMEKNPVVHSMENTNCLGNSKETSAERAVTSPLT